MVFNELFETALKNVDCTYAGRNAAIDAFCYVLRDLMKEYIDESDWEYCWVGTNYNDDPSITLNAFGESEKIYFKVKTKIKNKKYVYGEHVCYYEPVAVYTYSEIENYDVADFLRYKFENSEAINRGRDRKNTEQNIINKNIDLINNMNELINKYNELDDTERRIVRQKINYMSY